MTNVRQSDVSDGNIYKIKNKLLKKSYYLY